MCGIFGYKGNKEATNILLNGLGRLEYRGYDSAGIAFGGNNQNINSIKSIGRVGFLEGKVGKKEGNNFGIAHTRWATHGEVNIENTHPHTSQDGKTKIVHNGIIENHKQLRQQLEKNGYKFSSQTDSEVIAALIQENKDKDLLKTVENILHKLEGAYAFLVIHEDFPGQIIGVRYGSPLVFGYTDEGEFFFSSDVTALGGYTNNIIFMDDGDLIFVNNNDFLTKSEGKLVSKAIEKVDTENLVADKGDFQHFMLKEIFEQSQVMKEIFRGRVDFDNNSLQAEAFTQLDKYDFENIVFVGCGTSYHAGMLGSLRMQQIAGINASVEIASEFEYKNINIHPKTLYVFISQSGETADSISALNQVKKKGGKTLGLVNVVGSSIARQTDFGMFLRAGTEVGVASTKAFIAQISSILLLALYFGNKKSLSLIEFEKILKELKQIPDKIQEILEEKENIQTVAKDISKYKNFFFLGRNLQLPIAFESSLKFKEISYLHSEANGAGELKHGPLALIDENFPTVLINPNDYFFDKNISSMEEIKARKGKVIGIGDKDFHSDYFLKIPDSDYLLYPFLTTVVGQLLSYYVALELGNEIDKPRNLAKSVTVK
ncbi:glutamine--fructose-6-phosphate transaminase (isomerizing) [Candidatus Absconditicoccus praedator]|uniref:glutamine--fructose-6-phosphate transaminase (isomerizing) n=1 Tax=Candidatus Absconditicoccus praedator TaxID=2735562 RepID=UPI001E386958|nr:glutamine--fructose-6-phosphate transaminase (isomerizing) [Candidatus Absconditicoccus praedator]UFX82952.1 glutamine--fructose-6-phosphate transaminase (isomerizing) [Candidatus Absconditicoccus praedator]